MYRVVVTFVTLLFTTYTHASLKWRHTHWTKVIYSGDYVKIFSFTKLILLGSTMKVKLNIAYSFLYKLIEMFVLKFTYLSHDFFLIFVHHENFKVKAIHAVTRSEFCACSLVTSGSARETLARLFSRWSVCRPTLCRPVVHVPLIAVRAVTDVVNFMQCD